MNEPRYITVRVDDYPDKIVDGFLALLNLVRDLENRLKAVERYVDVKEGYDR